MREGADRVPVIVGVGQVNDRPESPEQGLDSVQLMAAALREAAKDGGDGVSLAQLDAILAVGQISFPELNPVGEKVAASLGLTQDLYLPVAFVTGDSPIRLLNDAANLIGSGEKNLVAVVGGEALRTAAHRAAAAAGNSASTHNATQEASKKSALNTYRGRYGLFAPIDVYPLYENAGRAAYGQTLEQAQHESGLIWSLFSQVAAENPGAWIRKPTSIEEIVTPSPNNRPLAFPYNKLMVANSSVNQGAGFIVTSLARARDMGVPEDRLIYVGRGAAGHECHEPLERDRFDRSPSMGVSITKALEINGLTIDQVDAVELYSCFPCVPKMARRVIDWPADKPATVHGGLTFGGGPIGNYMSHAVVGMVRELRQKGVNGLLFANGGYATENHTIVLTRTAQPAGTFPQSYDYQKEADAARGPAPELVEDYTGPGTIETYTVLYDRSGPPRWGVIVARTPQGQRFLAKIPGEDEAGIAFLTDGKREPVGTPGEAALGPDGLAVWRRDGT